MTLDQAVEYVVDAAKALGYSHSQLNMLLPDLRELLYALPSTDEDEVNTFIEEML